MDNAQIKAFLVVGPFAWGCDKSRDKAVSICRANIPRYVAGPHTLEVIEFNCKPADLCIYAGADLRWDAPLGSEVGRVKVKVKAGRR